MSFKPYEHKVQYYETDTMKIVHHSNYVRWMEEARVDLLEQMGLGYDVMEKSGVLSPVLSVHCEYKSMTRFPERVQITIKLLSYTGVRFSFAYEIRDQQTNTLRAEGITTHCFTDINGNPLSIRRKYPDWDKIFRENCEKQ